MATTPSLAERLADPSRPVFLLGEVPPGEGTPPGQCQTISDKFSARSRALATDGFIVYDIQDEPGRSDTKRPFPFRKLMDSAPYAALLARTSGKECLVYKCIADASLGEWMVQTKQEYGHSAINLVGRASSSGTYEGPTMEQAMNMAAAQKPTNGLKFGCVCIAERHTMESAKARGKAYPTEHLNMIRKQMAGAEWFISQAVYDPEPTIRLLKDYAALCRQKGVMPQKVVLTFCPVSRLKTMNFIKWLGIQVPPAIEASILNDETSPVDRSISILCDHLKTILNECAGIGVPLGINCESVSIYKAEIDGVHELFRQLQAILLDTRGSPWIVQWVDVPHSISYKNQLMTFWKKQQGKEEDGAIISKNETLLIMRSLLVGALMGGFLVAFGVTVGLGSPHYRHHHQRHR